MDASGKDPRVESIDPHVTATVYLTMGIGVAMAWIGARTGLLEFRPNRRRCPSCGHIVARSARCRCAS